MHGIIFSELKRYAEDRLGDDCWRELLVEAGLDSRLYLAVTTYPDEEAIALVGAAAARAGLPVPAALEGFGVFIAPTLLSMYKSHVRPEWRTLDLLENTEPTIHTVVRRRNPGASPAVLRCTREASDRLELVYSSERRLCPLAIGIVRGVAAHYGEQITIDQTQCMYDGADSCTMAVRTKALAGAAAS